jgi:para-nitrobenzyl esterase
VLVWFHGGAWVSGAGSWKWYGGHRLARDGDVVVVSANYRLGVLGYLRAPGISGGNLGLADQLAALRWGGLLPPRSSPGHQAQRRRRPRVDLPV